MKRELSLVTWSSGIALVLFILSQHEQIFNHFFRKLCATTNWGGFATWAENAIRGTAHDYYD
jgi:hypothetical protein